MFFHSVGDNIERRGLISAAPYWLIAFLLFGAVVAFLIPDAFWSPENQGTSVAVFSGVLTFNGIMLALGWGIFTKIYEILSDKDFSRFLIRNNLLDHHLFYIDFTHASLMLSSVLSLIGLISVIIDISAWLDIIAMVLVLGFTVWSLRNIFDAVSLMNDIIWEFANTEGDGKGGIRVLHNGNGK